MRRTRYFAYGSNLDPGQMRRRCPTAVPIGPARLLGWRLVFGGHSRAWGGPVATLVRGAGDRVAGLLYELSRADLAELDRFEGHPLLYQRRRLRELSDMSEICAGSSSTTSTTSSTSTSRSPNLWRSTRAPH